MGRGAVRRGSRTTHRIDVNLFLADIGLIDGSSSFAGPLPVNGSVRMIEITDGTANTILLAEAGGRPGVGWASPMTSRAREECIPGGAAHTAAGRRCAWPTARSTSSATRWNCACWPASPPAAAASRRRIFDWRRLEVGSRLCENSMPPPPTIRDVTAHGAVGSAPSLDPTYGSAPRARLALGCVFHSPG